MVCFRLAFPQRTQTGERHICAELKRLGSAYVNLSKQISMLSFSGVWEA